MSYTLPARSILKIKNVPASSLYHKWVAPGSAETIKHNITSNDDHIIAANDTDKTAHLRLGISPSLLKCFARDAMMELLGRDPRKTPQAA